MILNLKEISFLIQQFFFNFENLSKNSKLQSKLFETQKTKFFSSAKIIYFNEKLNFKLNLSISLLNLEKIMYFDGSNF